MLVCPLVGTMSQPGVIAFIARGGQARLFLLVSDGLQGIQARELTFS